MRLSMSATCRIDMDVRQAIGRLWRRGPADPASMQLARRSKNERFAARPAQWLLLARSAVCGQRGHGPGVSVEVTCQQGCHLAKGTFPPVRSSEIPRVKRFSRSGAPAEAVAGEPGWKNIPSGLFDVEDLGFQFLRESGKPLDQSFKEGEALGVF